MLARRLLTAPTMQDAMNLSAVSRHGAWVGSAPEATTRLKIRSDSRLGLGHYFRGRPCSLPCGWGAPGPRQIPRLAHITWHSQSLQSSAQAGELESS